MAGHVVRIAEKMNTCWGLVGKLERTVLCRPKWRREDDSEMGLREYDGLIRTGLIWLRTETSGWFV